MKAVHIYAFFNTLLCLLLLNSFVISYKTCLHFQAVSNNVKTFHLFVYIQHFITLFLTKKLKPRNVIFTRICVTLETYVTKLYTKFQENIVTVRYPSLLSSEVNLKFRNGLLNNEKTSTYIFKNKSIDDISKGASSVRPS